MTIMLHPILSYMFSDVCVVVHIVKGMVFLECLRRHLCRDWLLIYMYFISDSRRRFMTLLRVKILKAFRSPFNGRNKIICLLYIDWGLKYFKQFIPFINIYNVNIFPSLNPAKIFSSFPDEQSQQKVRQLDRITAQWLIHQMKLRARYCGNFEFIIFLWGF